MIRASGLSSLTWSHFLSVTIQIVHLSCLNALLPGREASLVLLALLYPAHPGVLIMPNRHLLLRQRLHEDLVPLARDISTNYKNRISFALQRSSGAPPGAVTQTQPVSSSSHHRLCNNLGFGKRGALTADKQQISPAELHGGIPSPELTAQAGLLRVQGCSFLHTCSLHGSQTDR